MIIFSFILQIYVHKKEEAELGTLNAMFSIIFLYKGKKVFSFYVFVVAFVICITRPGPRLQLKFIRHAICCNLYKFSSRKLQFHYVCL